MTTRAKRKYPKPGPEAATANGTHPGPAAGAGDTRLVPVGRIAPSLTNPRRHFDPDELARLAENLKTVGVLQAILLRPWPADRPQPSTGSDVDETVDYELVFGERRWRAACLAGLDVIPARVADLTDRQVVEVQVIENDRRVDTTPLEKAEGYARLVEPPHNVPVAEVAAKVGTSVSTVRGLLKLRQLPAIARAALDAGTIPHSTATLIARVPSAEARERLASHVLAGEEFWQDGPITQEEIDVALRLGNGPLSYKATRELIERELVKELKGATFSRKALDLVPGAGSCDACPKRVGNLQAEDPEAWVGVRADVCTDPPCYRAKAAAHRRKLLDRANKQGVSNEMPDLVAQRTFTPDGALVFMSGWIDLDELWDNGKPPSKRKTYRELVGRQVLAHTTAAVDPKGKLRLLAPSLHVQAELRAAGLLGDAGGGKPTASGKTFHLIGKSGGPTPEEMGETAARADAPAPEPDPPKPRVPTPHQVQQRAARLAGQALYESIEEHTAGLELLAGDDKNPFVDALRLACLGMVWDADGAEQTDLGDGILSLVDTLGHDGPRHDPIAPFPHWINRADPAKLVGFLLKGYARRLLAYPEMPGTSAARAAYLDWGGLDWDRLREQARRELTGGGEEQTSAPQLPTPTHDEGGDVYDPDEEVDPEAEGPDVDPTPPLAEWVFAGDDRLTGELRYALHSFEGAAGRWAKLRQEGADDARLKEAVGYEFGSFGSTHGPGRLGNTHAGGKNPRFWMGDILHTEKPTLSGKKLLDKVREVLGIPRPGDTKPQAADSSEGEGATPQGPAVSGGAGDGVPAAPTPPSSPTCHRCGSPGDEADPALADAPEDLVPLATQPDEVLAMLGVKTRGEAANRWICCRCRDEVRRPAKKGKGKR